jgi:hypothetical protein
MAHAREHGGLGLCQDKAWQDKSTGHVTSFDVYKLELGGFRYIGQLFTLSSDFDLIVQPPVCTLTLGTYLSSYKNESLLFLELQLPVP